MTRKQKKYRITKKTDKKTENEIKFEEKDNKNIETGTMNRNEHDTIIDNRDTEMKINETTEKYVTEFEIYRKKQISYSKNDRNNKSLFDMGTEEVQK